MINLDKIQHVAVLGAAGKMGSGILYLNTLYLSQLALNKKFTAKMGRKKHYCPPCIIC